MIGTGRGSIKTRRGLNYYEYTLAHLSGGRWSLESEDSPGDEGLPMQPIDATAINNAAATDDGARPAARLAIPSVMTAALALKLTLVFRAIGFEQGDPLEYINIAHTLAFRTGEEWWDIRPLVYPLLLVPVIWLGAAVPDPTGEISVRLLRLTPLVFSLATILIGASIARHISGQIASIACALVLVGNVTVNQLSVSPFAEVPATFFILLSAFIVLRGRPSLTTGLLAGLALGVGCMARYQSLAFIAPFGLWALLRDRGRLLPGFMTALVLCGGLQALLDQLAYGAPFHSLLQSAAYNVTTDEAAAFYGAEPPSWYLTSVGEWLGYPTLILALLGAAGGLRTGPRWSWGLVLGLAVTMLIWLSLIAHKELRFTSQITPFLAIAAGHGVAMIAGAGRPAGAIVAAGAIAAASVPGIIQSISLDLTFNPGFVLGPQRVAAERPGAVLGTIPWFIARPYTHGKIELVRADVDRWSDREYMAEVLGRADYILLREYDFLADRTIQRIVDSQFRTIETYPEQVVLLQHRRLQEPERPSRRSR